MGAKRYLMPIVWATVVLSLLAGFTGCGSGIQPAAQNPTADSLLDITWPPEAIPTRTVSDDEIILLGNQFSSAGGSIESIPPITSVTFSTNANLSFAMYSIAGFGSGIDLDSILADYSVDDPVGSEGSTQLYFGISNYTLGRWSWFLGDPANPEIFFPNATDLPAENGNLQLVVAHQGEGTATLNSISFRRVGDTTLYPPENLVIVPGVNEMFLRWDEVPGASGYNVFRNQARADESYQLLNPVPLTDNTFQDLTVSRNLIYYYRVSAVSHVESEMGERVDIYSPQEDLYLPLNHQVADNGIDFFRVTWDWEGENPDSWVLVLKEEDNFDLLEPVSIYPVSFPFKRNYRFGDLVPGKVYYWRICAVVNGKRGKMTDDLPGVTAGLWTWDPIEEIGPGKFPLTVVTADNDLSVAYLNGVNGDFARRSGGTWVAEQVLTSMVEASIANIDIAFGAGKYIIGGMDGTPGDALVAIGNPGNWDMSRIDGDGSTAPGHENSGMNFQVAANDSYFLAIHQNDSFLVFYQITPTDTINWSAKSSMWAIFHGDSQYSLASTADNFYLLWYRREIGNEGLSFYSYDDAAWNMVDIFPAGPSEIGHYNDLTMSSTGDWFSPAYNPSAFEMNFIQESEGTWSNVPVEGDRQGDYANMVAVGDRMFSLFKNRELGVWMLAIYDAGVWDISPFAIPGVVIKRAKLAAIGDTPYIVFQDDNDDTIKCAAGSPPV